VDSLADWRSARRGLLARGSVPSATLVRPSSTTAADAAGRRDRGRREGEGRRLGALVHATLAAVDLARPEDAASLAETLAARRGLPLDLVSAAVRRVRRALDGPVLARARRASWVAQEWPVTAEVDGALVDGRVDLVFEEAEGLVVVEFKVEGDARDEGDADEQARLYARAVARATGRRVHETLVVPLPG
jgi:ATP-dependent exoDNAse (exonuclease V) beta subunit